MCVFRLLYTSTLCCIVYSVNIRHGSKVCFDLSNVVARVIVVWQCVLNVSARLSCFETSLESVDDEQVRLIWL